MVVMLEAHMPAGAERVFRLGSRFPEVGKRSAAPVELAVAVAVDTAPGVVGTAVVDTAVADTAVAAGDIGSESAAAAAAGQYTEHLAVEVGHSECRLEQGLGSAAAGQWHIGLR